MTISRIFFEELKIDASIGILEHELNQKQLILVDADIEIKLTQPVDDLDISTVLDYRQIKELITEECTRTHVHLVEYLGEIVVDRLIAEFQEIQSVKLRISKPAAFVNCKAVGVEFFKKRYE